MASDGGVVVGGRRCGRVEAPCRRRARVGSEFCPLHGGGLRAGAPARRVLAVSVLEERFAAVLGDGPLDPLRELEGELRRTKAQILALEAVVYSGSLDGEPLWGETQTGVVESRVESPEAVHLHRKQQHFKGLVETALKFGLEERRVQIAEQEAMTLQEAFARAMVELGVDGLEARLTFARHLDAMEVGVVGETDPIRAELVAAVPDSNFDGLEGAGLFGDGPDLALEIGRRPEDRVVGGNQSKLREGMVQLDSADPRRALELADEVIASDRAWLELNDRRRARGMPPLADRGSMSVAKVPE